MCFRPSCLLWCSYENRDIGNLVCLFSTNIVLNWATDSKWQILSHNKTFRLRYTVDSDALQKDVFLLIFRWMQRYVHRYIKSVEKSEIKVNFSVTIHRFHVLIQRINRHRKLWCPTKTSILKLAYDAFLASSYSSWTTTFSSVSSIW